MLSFHFLHRILAYEQIGRFKIYMHVCQPFISAKKCIFSMRIESEVILSAYFHHEIILLIQYPSCLSLLLQSQEKEYTSPSQ